MEDIDDSLSGSNITVNGIINLERSPHTYNKKVYSLLLGKSLQNNYASRIGLNLYQIPEGEYTICIEFIPVTVNGVSVDVESTSLNINKQSTKSFHIILEVLLICINGTLVRQSTLWLI